jgi:hypothetical protein
MMDFVSWDDEKFQIYEKIKHVPTTNQILIHIYITAKRWLCTPVPLGDFHFACAIAGHFWMAMGGPVYLYCLLIVVGSGMAQ